MKSNSVQHYQTMLNPYLDTPYHNHRTSWSPLL